MVFNISIWDPLYPQLVEEASIRDRDQQWYLIKQINGGSSTAKIVAQLDLDAWKATMYVGYSNNSATLDQTILGVIPAGWSLIDSTGLTMQRTIEGDYTPLEILEQCRDTYGVYFKFDNVAQTVTVIIPDAAAPLGAFATRQLNLKEINYKGKSNDLVTRLYAYGKDGLSFASINNGLPYVENTGYKNKIVCAIWKDDRYTIAENLLADAKAMLAASAVPSRSYDCDVVDLRATNPEMYGFQNFDVFSVATLIDDAKNFAINYQVVERWDYPYYPEKNKVIFSESPAKIQSQVTQITQAIENPNSGFQQQMQAAISNATNWITNGKGYMVAIKDADGNWMEICSLDTPDISTAANVWRWNNGGFGHSSTGYNGPYTTAITQDGAIVANFITVGTLNAALANIINLNASNLITGTIKSTNGALTIDLDNAAMVAGNGASVKIGSATSYTQFLWQGFQSFVNGVLQSGVENGLSWVNRSMTIFYSASGLTCVGYRNAAGQYTPGYVSDPYSDLQSGYVNYLNGNTYCTGTSKAYIQRCGYQLFLENSVGGQNDAQIQAYDAYVQIYGLGLKVNGNIECTGDKNRVVNTKSYGLRALNAMESPSPVFCDSGSGVLNENGECMLFIHPILEECIDPEAIPQWIVTGSSPGFWVEKDWSSATVHGPAGATFDWILIAKQRGCSGVYAKARPQQKAPVGGTSQTALNIVAEEIKRQTEEYSSMLDAIVAEQEALYKMMEA